MRKRSATGRSANRRSLGLSRIPKRSGTRNASRRKSSCPNRTPMRNGARHRNPTKSRGSRQALKRSGARRKTGSGRGRVNTIAANRKSLFDSSSPVDQPCRARAARGRGDNWFPGPAGRDRMTIRVPGRSRVSATGVRCQPRNRSSRSCRTGRCSRWGNSGGASPAAAASLSARGRSLPAKTNTTGLQTRSSKTGIARRRRPPCGFFGAPIQSFPRWTDRTISSRPLISD
jgi:hypothetical protein